MGERSKKEQGGGSDMHGSKGVYSGLTGADRLDEALLDRAVRDLNRLVAMKGLGKVFEVGRYVIETFFDGDYGAFREQRKSSVTFRQLGRRKDLVLSHSSIYHYVAVAEQVERLPDELAWALSFSHHKVLLPVKDPETELALARAAVDEDLMVAALQVRVHAFLDRTPWKRTGLRPLPAEVKKLSRLEKAAERIDIDEISGEGILEHFDAPRLERLAGNLGGLSQALLGALHQPEGGGG